MSDADTSEKSNTAAAFAFLKEIEDRKAEANEIACEDDNQGDKILFNTRKRVHTTTKFSKSAHLKSVVIDDCTDPVIDLPKLKGSKVVMPEYVIGQKKERKKSTGKTNTEIGSKKPAEMLKLDHLFEEDEEE